MAGWPLLSTPPTHTHSHLTWKESDTYKADKTLMWRAVPEVRLCRGGKEFTHWEATSKASTALLHIMCAAAVGAER